MLGHHLSSSRALGKARNCKLTVRCPHDTDVDYSEEMVKQVVLAGMYDDEIKRKILSTAAILNDTIAIIEMEEMASRSMTGISLPAQVGATSFNAVSDGVAAALDSAMSGMTLGIVLGCLSVMLFIPVIEKIKRVSRRPGQD